MSTLEQPVRSLSLLSYSSANPSTGRGPREELEDPRGPVPHRRRRRRGRQLAHRYADVPEPRDGQGRATRQEGRHGCVVARLCHPRVRDWATAMEQSRQRVVRPPFMFLNHCPRNSSTTLVQGHHVPHRFVDDPRPCHNAPLTCPAPRHRRPTSAVARPEPAIGAWYRLHPAVSHD